MTICRWAPPLSLLHTLGTSRGVADAKSMSDCKIVCRGEHAPDIKLYYELRTTGEE